jgi:pimeloyl-[acyl-carrier protein] methyl ester esterase
MGAAVAWRYIAQHGATGLAGLVTVDMSPKIAPTEDWPFGLRGQTENGLREVTRHMKTDWPASAQSIAAAMFADGSDPRPFGRDAALAQILSEDACKMRGAWSDLLTLDARRTVPRITCPWVVAYGARSKVYGEDVARWLCDRAPNARLARFDAAGHSVHLEEPDAFADALSRFIGEVR